MSVLAFFSPLETANDLFSNGQYTEAAAAYKAVADDDPYNAYAWRGMGMCMVHLKDFEGAIKACKTAVELMPGNADLHYALGYTYVEAERFPEAISELDMVLILQPTHDEAKKGLVFAIIHEARSLIQTDPQRAQSLLQRAYGYEPRNPHILAPYLEVLYRGGQRGKVAQILVDSPEWLRAHEEVWPVLEKIHGNSAFETVIRQFEATQKASVVRPEMVMPIVHHTTERVSCPNCQLHIERSDVFCPYCGFKVKVGP